MKLPKDVCDILRKPLTEYKRRGPGGTYSYYKGSDIIRRLNEAFGHCWSSEKLEVTEHGNQVLMLVSLTVFLDGDTIIHQGYGSAQIARRSGSDEVIDIGNTYKSAFTNALKKAAEQFGIGLGEEDDVSDQSASSTGEESRPAAPRAAPAAPPPNRPPMTSRTSMQRPTALPARGSSPSIRKMAAAVVSATPSQGVPSPTRDVSTVLDTGEESINNTQERALQQLSELKGIKDETALIRGALEGTTKTTFKELLKKEAILVIRYANDLPLKG